jgi:hypothetical protein
MVSLTPECLENYIEPLDSCIILLNKGLRTSICVRRSEEESHLTIQGRCHAPFLEMPNDG